MIYQLWPPLLGITFADPARWNKAMLPDWRPQDFDCVVFSESLGILTQLRPGFKSRSIYKSIKRSELLWWCLTVNLEVIWFVVPITWLWMDLLRLGYFWTEGLNKVYQWFIDVLLVSLMLFTYWSMNVIIGTNVIHALSVSPQNQAS